MRARRTAVAGDPIRRCCSRWIDERMLAELTVRATHHRSKESPRKDFLYWIDDGELVGVRYSNWKINFKIQEHTGFDVWKRGFTNLRVPEIYNIRADPFERGPESFEYTKWMFDRVYLLVPAQE